jgi:hypothetical protein
MSLQVLSERFVGRLWRIGEQISCSIDSNIHSKRIYLMCHASLLPVIFISLQIIAIQLIYGYFQFDIEFDGWYRSRMSEGGNSSNKSAHSHPETLGTNRIASGQPKGSPQVPAGPRVDSAPLLSAAGKAAR